MFAVEVRQLMELTPRTWSFKQTVKRLKPLSSLIHIDVTAEDIERGVPRSSDACPIARAAKRVLKGPLGVGVDDIAVFGPKERYYLLPDKAQRFLKKFDAKQPVKPISFDAELE